jgi:peroxiredoxin
VIGVSLDTPEANRAFAEKHRFPFPLIGDRSGRIARAYGAASSPRDEMARRVAYLIDENGVIAEAHPSVTPSSYPAEQLARLR